MVGRWKTGNRSASLAPYAGNDRTEFEKRSQLARWGRLDQLFGEAMTRRGAAGPVRARGSGGGWWQDARNELKAWGSENGSKGVVEGWSTGRDAARSGAGTPDDGRRAQTVGRGAASGIRS